MNGRRLLVLAVAASAPLLWAAPTLQLAPVTVEQLAEPISAVGRGGPVELGYEASCSPSVPGLGVVRLEWRPAHAAMGGQRVDVSPFPEGFASGRYDATAPLEPGVSGGQLERLEPGVNYFWRVLRREGAGWVASETSRFEAPTCPVDRTILPDEK